MGQEFFRHIQRTTRTARMKYLLPILILSFAVLMACGAPQPSKDAEANVSTRNGKRSKKIIQKQKKIIHDMCHEMKQVMKGVFRELATHTEARALAQELKEVDWKTGLGQVAQELENVDWETGLGYVAQELENVDWETGLGNVAQVLENVDWETGFENAENYLQSELYNQPLDPNIEQG